MRKIVYDIVRLKYSLHLMMRIILQRVLKKMKEHLCPNVSMAMIIESYLKLWTHKPHCIDKEGLLVDWQPCMSPSCTGISPWLPMCVHGLLFSRVWVILPTLWTSSFHLCGLSSVPSYFKKKTKKQKSNNLFVCTSTGKSSKCPF